MKYRYSSFTTILLWPIFCFVEKNYFLMKFCFTKLHRAMEITKNYLYDASMPFSFNKKNPPEVKRYVHFVNI